MSWYTAQQLADLKLPTFPGSKRGVQNLAKTEGWAERVDAMGEPLSRKRKGQGGGTEYHVSVLPAPVKARLLAEEETAVIAEPAANTGGRSEAWQTFQRRPETQRQKAFGRVAIMDEVAALEATGSTRSAAITIVARRNAIGASTLRQWFEFVEGVPREEWPAFVISRHTGRTKEAECTPEAWDMLVTLYLQSNRPQFSTCYRRVERAAKERGWTLPQQRTLKRRMDREIPREAQQLARHGEKAFEQTKPAQKRDRSHFTANEALNADGHRFDVWVKYPGEAKPSRPILVAFQDLYSGKILAWRLCRTENADAVRLAFGDLVERWGVPSKVWLDNGHAFAGKIMSGGAPSRFRFKVNNDEAQGIFGNFGVEVHFTLPARGQSKPIERAFKDLCAEIAQHPDFVGAWTGNSPANKPEDYGSRAIPFDTFAKRVAEEITLHNARPGRRGGSCAGRSFDETFAESYERNPVKWASPEQRRLYLLARAIRRANRRSGQVTLDGNGYWAPALSAYAGKELVVHYDPQALKKPVSIYTKDGRFICEAVCAVPEGFDNTDDARDNARANRQRRKATQQLLDAERRMSLTGAIERLATVETPDDIAPGVVRLVPQGRPQERPRQRAVGDHTVASQPSILDRAAYNVAQFTTARPRRGD